MLGALPYHQWKKGLYCKFPHFLCCVSWRGGEPRSICAGGVWFGSGSPGHDCPGVGAGSVNQQVYYGMVCVHNVMQVLHMFPVNFTG